jgi:hypothetical protein
MKTQRITYYHNSNSAKVWMFLLLGVLILFLTSCYEMTVQVAKVPSNTPEDEPIYITGNFNNWDPGDNRYVLQQAGDSLYEVKLPRGIGSLEYKFTRGDWTTVEKDICGFEIDNRILVYGRSEEVTDTIRSWNDLAPVDCPYVTLVIDNLPENTPMESDLSVAGTFNDWDPGEEGWKFQYDSILQKPILRLPRMGVDRTIDLKITRGSLERVEADARGREILPRKITFGEEDTIYLDVEGWEDLSGEKSNLLTVFITKLPDNTPAGDPIFITGDFNGWYPRSGDYRLERNQKGEYFIYLPKRGRQFECKFTRGSWSTEEVDRWGYRIANRVISYDQDTAFIEIDNWRDLTQPDGPPVRVVVEAVPESTPENADLYIAGNFNRWNPGDRDYRMIRNADGSYYIDIPRSEYTLDFKITRGNWGTVECRPNGDDIENRVYAFKDFTEIRISVAAWKDR